VRFYAEAHGTRGFRGVSLQATFSYFSVAVPMSIVMVPTNTAIAIPENNRPVVNAVAIMMFFLSGNSDNPTDLSTMNHFCAAIPIPWPTLQSKKHTAHH